MATWRFTFVALLFLAHWRGCDSAPDKYRFFQVKKSLFATNGTNLWHVLFSQTNRSGKEDEASSDINFVMVGPHTMFDHGFTELDFDHNPFKLTFVARPHEKCTLLVLVNQKLDYELWQIKVSPNFSKTITVSKPPFVLQMLSDSETCKLDVPKTANLRVLPSLELLFAANQTVTSVLSTEYNKVLYFVGNDKYLKVNLDNWSTLQSNFTKDNITEMVPLNSRFPDDQIMALYDIPGQNKYVLLQGHNSTQVCAINSLHQWMHISKACKSISYLYKQQKMGRSLEINLGESNYEEATTPSKANSMLLIMVLSVVAFVLVLVFGYIVAAKFLCQDSVATIPFSGLNSKFVGKLQSTSSIKTLASDEEHKALKASGKARK